jgi:hypothetical protein
MIDPDHPRLSIVRQCELASISRSSFYREPTAARQTHFAHRPTNALAGPPLYLTMKIASAELISMNVQLSLGHFFRRA